MPNSSESPATHTEHTETAEQTKQCLIALNPLQPTHKEKNWKQDKNILLRDKTYIGLTCSKRKEQYRTHVDQTR